jgi:hypothetical protein
LHRLFGQDKCPGCGKWVSDEEYVVNWASCADCFGKHIDTYFATQEAAKARLQRIVDERANSMEIRNFRANRAAAKAGWRKRKGLA